MDYTTSYDPTCHPDVGVDIYRCHVTGNLLHVSQMIHDYWEGRWCTKGLEYEYNEMLSKEYNWSEEEKLNNLQILKLI